jgi:hypothetical protein
MMCACYCGSCGGSGVSNASSLGSAGSLFPFTFFTSSQQSQQEERQQETKKNAVCNIGCNSASAPSARSNKDVSLVGSTNSIVIKDNSSASAVVIVAEEIWQAAS